MKLLAPCYFQALPCILLLANISSVLGFLIFSNYLLYSPSFSPVYFLSVYQQLTLPSEAPFFVCLSLIDFTDLVNKENYI